MFEPGVTPDLTKTIERWYNPLVRKLRSLPDADRLRRQRGRGGRRREHRACLRHRARRPLGEVHPGLRQDRACCRIPAGPGSCRASSAPARARGLALLAEPLPAEKAEAWGLIWKAVDDESLMIEAEKLAAHLATQPTIGLALTKQALDASWGNTLDRQLDLERDLQGEAGRTPDYAEGVSAFFAKRAPSFTGRR